MSSQIVQDTMWKFLEENWKQTPIIKVDNTPDALPPNLCEWVTFQFFYADELQTTIGEPGENYYAEEGEFLLYVFVPTGTGKDLLNAYGKQLQDLFRAKQFIEGIQIMYVTAPAPREQQPLQEGAWYAEALAIGYLCHKREGENQ